MALLRRLATNAPRGLRALSSSPRTTDDLDLTFNSPRDAFKSKKTSELVRAYLVYQICSINWIVENNDMRGCKTPLKLTGSRILEFDSAAQRATRPRPHVVLCGHVSGSPRRLDYAFVISKMLRYVNGESPHLYLLSRAGLNTNILTLNYRKLFVSLDFPYMTAASYDQFVVFE
ncbi:Proline dehydrogenase 1, mitochondrial [Papilio xuthus]|uniref:Proline dehydrogenase 1, mitochondrial n=1 Tax=Papilio xuthus TaxID=66420 RepID=A0A0N1I9S3_PAPXU|nr:Proline dehydrogenase 1, mitochondrial [Papilio xuthus]